MFVSVDVDVDVDVKLSSSRANHVRISFNSKSRPWGVDTSAWTPETSRPIPCHSSRQRRSSSELREHVNTRHPPGCRASPSTIAFPIPFVPPVTTAVVLCGRGCVVFVCVCVIGAAAGNAQPAGVGVGVGVGTVDVAIEVARAAVGVEVAVVAVVAAETT